MRGSALNDMTDDVDLSAVSSTMNDEAAGELDFGAVTDSQSAMQLKNRYILSPSKSGLMVIDQHRAHVRILYDRYIDLANLDALSTQRVIFPEVVDLTAAQNAVMEGIVDEANALGFDISCLGDNSWTLNGMPSVMNDVNPRELMLSMIDTVVDGSGKIADDLRHIHGDRKSVV